MEHQTSRSGRGGLLLNDLVQQIAHLPAREREPILQGIDKLRCLLEETERQLQECDERFHSLADSSPLSIWISDIQGGDVYVNQTTREYLRTTIDEMRGQNWQQYLHPEDAPA